MTNCGPALTKPDLDPTPIFEHFRGAYATELLTAAVAHLGLFSTLAEQPLGLVDLGERLGLGERPTMVLTTALRAMGFVEVDQQQRFALNAMAREHLIPGAAFDVTGYIGLAAESPGVLEMVQRLRTNRPAGAEADKESPTDGVAFIYRENEKSRMEHEASARHLTMSLAGRAKNVAPHLAEQIDLDNARLLLDVAGGSGIYSVACLQRQPHLQAIVLDRPEVLKVAQEMAETYGVADRLQCEPGDMFVDPMPKGADRILLSNVLHDWDVADCRELVSRCADALPVGGQLIIHDVFLNDELDGPLPIALYSAALFTLTEGRAYSAGEFRQWLTEAGLTPGEIRPTAVHCGVLAGVKV